jgi:hypothetical protein
LEAGLALAGALLVATAAALGLAWLWRQGPLDRPVGWPKPTVFTLSLQLLQPLAALSLEHDLRRVGSPGATPEERLAAKRALLSEYAASEADQRGWFAHLGPLFLNASVAGVLYWALDNPTQAGLQLSIGLLVSQLRVWTAPRVATRALRGDLRRAPQSVPALPVATADIWGIAVAF